MADSIPSRGSLGDNRLVRPAAPQLDGIYCAGVSFRTADLKIRDRLALDVSAQSAVLSRLGCGHDSRPFPLSELVVLSTCNRTEVYVAGAAAARDALPALLADATGVPIDEVAPATYVLSGAEVVRHLVRVACGLDSLAVGEPQILGQVADAYSLSMTHGASGPVLSAIFRGAIRAGRRARSETGIGRHPVTISSVATRAIASVVPELASARVLVIGGGEMGGLAISALHHRGVRDLTVMTRTQESSEEVAARFGAKSATFERMNDALRAADVVVSSTTAPHFIITADIVAAAMQQRPERPLVLMDIAVPRDIDPASGDVKGVTLLDLDSLQRHAEANVAVREGEIPAVETIVADETAAIMTWLHQLDVAPLVAELRAHTDAIRRSVLDRSARHFSHLSEDDRRRLEWFSASLVNAVLHEPTARLRNDALSGDSARYALALRHLFGLEK
jgi:glutamyl-tRNA reductase